MPAPRNCCAGPPRAPCSSPSSPACPGSSSRSSGTRCPPPRRTAVAGRGTVGDRAARRPRGRPVAAVAALRGLRRRRTARLGDGCAHPPPRPRRPDAAAGPASRRRRAPRHGRRDPPRRPRAGDAGTRRGRRGHGGTGSRWGGGHEAGAARPTAGAPAADEAPDPAWTAPPTPGAGTGADTGLVAYVVQPPQGRHHDCLWDIAERTLGDPLRYREVFELNRDRVQADGSRLVDADLVRPGWTLLLPADAVAQTAPTRRGPPGAGRP